MDDAIDCAKKGDLEFFKKAPVDILLNARDSDGGTVLSIVVNGNRVDCCKEICKRCPSLLCSQHYQRGDTPLHVAAYRGYLDILKILINTCDKADLENQHDIGDQGGDRADRQKTLSLRSTTTKGSNAMHAAVVGGQPESIKLLIEADPNKELLKAGDNWNNTPLHRAVKENNLEIARLLIEAEPDFLYGANSDGETPLLMAIDNANNWHPDYEMLKLILELQPIQSRVKYNEKGWTALHYCVSEGYSLSIEYIIQSCPESSKVVDNKGQYFFHHAVKKLGNEEMVEEILRMKEITEEVLNSTDNSGKTPFQVAAESQNESMILCLHNDHRVNKKLTVTKHLNWVVEKHNIVILELFMTENDDFLMNIEKEVFLKSKNEEDETILFKAAEEGKPILCEKLCKRCPSLIYHQSRGGHTALHHAVSRESLIVVLPVLIKAGGVGFLSETARNHLLTIVDDHGDTALHKAVLNGQLQAVEDLVEADPDYDYRPNKSGHTPYMLSIEEARSKENKFNSGEIRRLLFKMQPRQTMAWRWRNGGGTLLHDAASKGDVSCIEDIIKFCPGILDVGDNEGKNFLHIAAELVKVEVVRLVLRAKDIPSNVLYNQDKYGNTPMHIAVKTGNLSLMECFLSDLRFSKIKPRGEENGWKLPHHAASDGDLGIIKDMEDLSKIRQIMDAAIDHARKGYLEFFKDAPLVILMNARDSDGGTVLSIVVNGNHVDCCEEICKRCPSLLCSQHYQGGEAPLHVAAYWGYLDILKILINTCDKADLENQHAIGDQGGEREDRQKSLTLITTTSVGYNAMHKAVHGGKLESIKLLIEADPNNELLRAGDNQNNTPLHLAVRINPDPVIIKIARLLIKADPDFRYGANSDGKTPLLVAIDKQAELHNGGDMISLILELQPIQSTVKYNEKGWTTLHYCVSRGSSLSIEYIIQSCPECSKVVDNEGQNFFHHAVKKLGNEKMVEEILRMKEITEEVLNSKDNLGRTPFDVAAESQNENMILCLYEDHRVNKKLTVTKKLNWVVEKHNIMILELFMRENDDFLMNIDKEILWKSRTKNGDTILIVAAQEGQSYLCEKLCERDPFLMFDRSNDKQTALHHAVWSESLRLLSVLIKVCFSNVFARLETYQIIRNPLFCEDDQGDTALHKAVKYNNLEAVEELVKADPDYEYRANHSGDTPIMISIQNAQSNEKNSVEIRRLLFRMQPKQTMAWRWREENGGTLLHKATSEEDLSCIQDIIKFCTGYLDVVDNNGKNFLHIAVELGKIEVVRLVLRAKDIPDNVFYKEDNNGNTPMHIAEKTGNDLMECFLSDLRFSKIMPHGKEKSWKLPHHAASEGNSGIIKDIIKWQSNMDVVDNEGKNFLHIAAEFEKVEVVKLILRAKDIPEPLRKKILNHQDRDGNTPFHIAAATGNEPLTRCFLFDKNVDKKIENENGEKALHAIKFPYDKRKARVVGIAHTVDQSELKDQSDLDLVVGALIATVSFAAGITVPGGYISDGPNQGTAVFSKRVSFASFTISNTFALVFSLFAVFTHFCARRLSWDEDIICLLNVAKVCTLAAMNCMMAAFIAGSFAILAKPNWLAIVVCIISCLFFIFGCGPLWMWMNGKRSKHPVSEPILNWFKKCFGLAKSCASITSCGKEGALPPRDVATHHQNTSSSG